MNRVWRAGGLLLLAVAAGCALSPAVNNVPGTVSSADQHCTLRLIDGWLVDGSGSRRRRADVLLAGERVLGIVKSTARRPGPRCDAHLDVSGLVVAPGFINMLSWATESLLHDPRALSDVKQGVTLEVLGEGRSMGPFYNPQKARVSSLHSNESFEVSWKTLGGYFDLLEHSGIGVNVASFVGATTIRELVLGGANRAPSDDELIKMQMYVAQAMREGAMGVGSSLIYAPANFATTEELIGLAQEASRFGGGYISHMRSEGRALLDGVRELIEIARASNTRAEVYHLKAAGEANWPKLNAAIAEIEAARREGLAITANMYPYVVGATGLDAVMPPWVQAGGTKKWIKRLKDPKIRARVIRQMRDPTPDWENFLLGGADRALLLGFRNRALRGYVGMTLQQVAKLRGTSAEDAAIDLVIADGGRVDVAYTLMSEDNLRKKLRLPWVSFGSDAAAPAAEGMFLNHNEQPRAYGSFARVLGKYVRDEGVLGLEEAIRRMTSLPASNLGLADRGRIAKGYYADLAIFAADEINDTATFKNSHSYAKGMRHVFVNGTRVLANGLPTGALAGRIVRGPGWDGR